MSSKRRQDLDDGARPVQSLNEPPQEIWIPQYRELTADSPYYDATGMLFDDGLPQWQAEPDRRFVIHPGARARRQDGTRSVGRIRLVASPDHPLLARTIDKEIGVEDVVRVDVFVERRVESGELAVCSLLLRDPAEPLACTLFALDILQFLSECERRFICGRRVCGIHTFASCGPVV